MRQLEKEKQKKEHILVCLSSSPSNEKIIRTAAQMAQAFQAGFTALYVQTAEKTEKTPEDLARLQKHVRLAEQSGAEIVTTHSEDIALQIAEYARISEVTRIVIGKSMMKQGYFHQRRVWTERLTVLCLIWKFTSFQTQTCTGDIRNEKNFRSGWSCLPGKN